MGQSRTQVVTDATTTRVVASYPLEKGNLTSLNASIPASGITTALIFARIGLTVDGDQTNNIVATLAEGFVGSGVSLNWSGSIPMSPGMRVLIESWGLVATTINLDAITT